MVDTSTGLKENTAGLLCYVLGWVSGIVFLIIEPNNKFVRFHAFQSIIVFAVLTVANIILSAVPIINVLLSAVIFIAWVALMVLAAMGKQYKVPWAGDLAEKWTK